MHAVSIGNILHFMQFIILIKNIKRVVCMKHFAVIGTLLLISAQGWCWGALGHKTSAQIAWQFMDRETRAKVTEVLNGTSITDASVWADAARGNSEWKYTTWYHFEKAPDNHTYLQNLERQDEATRKVGGLLEALYIAEDTMKDPLSNRTDKENALKFAIHFVGDIHQPLHTGRVEDNGGNKIRLRWLDFETSLHSVWDSQIIYLAHKELFAQSVDSLLPQEEQSKLYADFLMKKYKNYRPAPSVFSRYDDWMHESMVPRADAYDYRNETEQAYTDRFADVVDERIYLAGLRIAHVARRLVHQEKTTQPLETLRRGIIRIVGDFTEFVSLKPRH